MTQRCSLCGRVDGHAERCPNGSVCAHCGLAQGHKDSCPQAKPAQPCPHCGGTITHAPRCPTRNPQPKEEPKTKLDATVEDWAQNLADEIPKPRQVGIKTKVPIGTDDGGKLLGPDGHRLGMRSELVQDQSGPEQLWPGKLDKEPCFSCEHFNPDAFQQKDKEQLTAFLIREAQWSPQAAKVVLDSPGGWNDYGVCAAHSEGRDGLHIVHRAASCLRLYQPRKGWLKSLGGKIFGGSSRWGM